MCSLSAPNANSQVLFAVSWLPLVVCGDCSANRADLPQYGFEKPERVCDACCRALAYVTPSVLYWMTSPVATTEETPAEESTLLQPYDSSAHEESFLDQVSREEFTSPDAPNSRVVAYWHMLVSDSKHLNELRGRVLVGVPNYVRGMVWKQLSEATLAIRKNSTLYQTLAARPHPEFDEMISNDVHRTFPTNPLFADDCYGQAALFRILRAYCHMNNDYSQCMSYISAVLLMHMNEEDAFWVFVQMMKKYGLEAIFQRDLPQCLRNYSKFIEVARPALFQHLSNEKLTVEIFVSGWLQTLFAQQFDLGLVFRLWDVFFTHGFVFLIKVSLVLLRHAEPTLLKLSNTEIIFNLKSLPTRILDFDRLIEEAMQLQIPDSILDANTEEDRLLTLQPTINFDVPSAAISPSNPRLSLLIPHLIDPRKSNSSISSSQSTSPEKSSSTTTPTEPNPVFEQEHHHIPEEPLDHGFNIPHSPANTPPSGFIHRSATARSSVSEHSVSISSVPPAVSSSPPLSQATS